VIGNIAPFTLRPMNDRVLVRRLPEPPISALIIIPEVAQPDSMLGEVVAVGPGKRLPTGERLPLDVKPGDLVRWGPWTDYDDGELVLIQEGDIRGKLSNLPTVGSLPETPRYVGD
jgi:chaperonin GroES